MTLLAIWTASATISAALWAYACHCAYTLGGVENKEMPRAFFCGTGLCMLGGPVGLPIFAGLAVGYFFTMRREGK